MSGFHAGRRSVSGQMAVELAVLMPVIVVVSLVVYNLARFVATCAAFDRIALDAVLTQGVAPSGDQTSVVAVDSVRTCIEEALGSCDCCEVEVSAERAGGRDRGRLSLSGLLTRFRCALLYRPWPSSLVFAGVPYDAPFVLRHERTIVVDRYRPGVVV
jgi:hypothetical protein